VHRKGDPKSRSTIYDVRCEVFYGMMLPEKNAEYRITIKWGEYVMTTKKRPCKTRLVEFFERIEKRFEFVHSRIEDCPDIFVYLTKGTNT